MFGDKALGMVPFSAGQARKEHVMIKYLASFLVIASIAVPALTPAQARVATPSRPVSYADLNLATASGQKLLQARVSRAVRQVCGGPSGIVSAIELTDLKRCEREAWNSAKGRMETAIAQAMPASSREQVASR